MSELPAPGQHATAPIVVANRFGTITFCSDRPDLQWKNVQLVARSDGSVQLYDRAQPATCLYSMTTATLTYETQRDARRKIPTWAIVLAIIGFFFFFLGLLFLLVKETVYVDVPIARAVDQYGRTVVIRM
jgi:hypothetical protein